MFRGNPAEEADWNQPVLVHLMVKAIYLSGEWQVTKVHCGLTFMDGIGRHQLEITSSRYERFPDGFPPCLAIGVRDGKSCLFLRGANGRVSTHPKLAPHLKLGEYVLGQGSCLTPPLAAEGDTTPIVQTSEERVDDEAVDVDRALELVSLASTLLAVGETWGAAGPSSEETEEAVRKCLEADRQHIRQVLNRGLQAVLKK